LAGAAVVLLMKNRTMAAVADEVCQMVMHRMSQVKETAAEKGIYVNFGNSFFGKARSERMEDHDSGNLEDVEKLVSQDPHVKNEVNKILRENDQQPLS
jgi:hypothetical protein